MAEWDPDARLEDLTTELTLSDGDHTKAAERIFRENLILAAQSICHSAVYSINERVRLDAAKYVVERNMGRLGDSNPLDNFDPMEEFLHDIVRQG